MNSALARSADMTSSIPYDKTQIEQLLDALIQLRWLVEDRAPINANAVLEAIWRTQVRLLTESGHLPWPELGRLLDVLRGNVEPSHPRLGGLVQRLERILDCPVV